MTRLINLTPHSIVMYRPEAPDRLVSAAAEPVRIIPPSADVPAARVAVDALIDENLVPSLGPAIPVWATVYHLDQIEGLPDPQPQTVYIVSLPVALAAPHREDLLVPFREVRNLVGTVIGCRGLARVVTRS